MKKERLLSHHRIFKGAWGMEGKDSLPFTGGIDAICSGNLFHVREKV